MFERLTADKVYLNSIRFGIQVNFPPHCGHEKAKEVDDFVKNVFDRLAAYEDSGLSPEEVQKLEKSDASKEQCIIDQHGEIHRLRDELKRYKQAEQEGRLVVLPETGIGDLSDGYHTFNELYHHRAILFSVICNEHPDISWKSKLHHDGTMFDGMFIVGINTPEGQATYHYDINPYWDMFRVRELEKAPEWDGHTPTQAIERIASLNKIRSAEK
jgi:hypothetical protein